MHLSDGEGEVEGVLEELRAAVLVDTIHTARRLLVECLKRGRWGGEGRREEGERGGWECGRGEGVKKRRRG